MIHIIKTLIAVVLAVFLTLGAVYNRQEASLSLGPFHDDFQIPVYLLIYGGLATGFLLGVVYGWLHYGPLGRWSKKRQKKKREKQKSRNDRSEEISEEMQDILPPSTRD